MIPPINIVAQKNKLFKGFRINNLNQLFQGCNAPMNITNSNNPTMFRYNWLHPKSKLKKIEKSQNFIFTPTHT